jgi:hypothetical protein
MLFKLEFELRHFLRQDNQIFLHFVETNTDASSNVIRLNLKLVINVEQQQQNIYLNTHQNNSHMFSVCR